jgi:hypothetical protein
LIQDYVPLQVVLNRLRVAKLVEVTDFDGNALQMIAKLSPDLQEQLCQHIAGFRDNLLKMVQRRAWISNCVAHLAIIFPPPLEVICAFPITALFTGQNYYAQ